MFKTERMRNDVALEFRIKFENIFENNLSTTAYVKTILILWVRSELCEFNKIYNCVEVFGKDNFWTFCAGFISYNKLMSDFYEMYSVEKCL